MSQKICFNPSTLPDFSPIPEFASTSYARDAHRHFPGREVSRFMAKVTIVFGIVLILLGIFSCVATGSQYPTSLIPTGFGVLLAIFGGLAISQDEKKRKLFMHIALTLGLVGFIATVKGLAQYVLMLNGHSYALPAAVEEKAAMSLLMLIFVLLCVRSFIAVRRARV